MSEISQPRLSLRIVRKVKETSDAATLFLEPLEGKLEYKAGQFVVLVFDQLGPKTFRRSYSFSSSPGVDQLASITVKRIINGAASNYLVNESKPGDVLQALVPAGSFTLNDQNEGDIFLIGGGSGITPLFSILKFGLHEAPERSIHLLYANRNRASTIFKNQLLDFADRYKGRLYIHFLLSDSKEAFILKNEINNRAEVTSGRLSKSRVHKWVSSSLSGNLDKAEFFICGPRGLRIKARMTIGFMGFAEAMVKQEIFTVAEPIRPDPGTLNDCQVSLNYLGQDFNLKLEAGESILEAAERIGINLPYSCRSGICTTCAGTCLEGNVANYTQEGYSESSETNQLVLCCVGFPLTKKVKLKI